MHQTLHRLTMTALAAFILLASASVAAQDFPNKPIRIIVPLTPGGVTDLLGRTLAGGFTLRC